MEPSPTTTTFVDRLRLAFLEGSEALPLLTTYQSRVMILAVTS